MAAVFTLYFCGTDCWTDESLADRSENGGSNPLIFSPIAGYIPTKLFSQHRHSARNMAAVIPGPGGPWYDAWQELWVPCTIKTTGRGARDTATGESMWDLAGHAAAKVVGIPSMGRGAKRPRTNGINEPFQRILRGVGANLNSDVKPPSHKCFQWQESLVPLLENVLSSPNYRNRGKITKINMIGHSRGGVTAIMAAHELKYIFPEASVNIFAIDPVPGTGTLSKEMMSLATNVRNYVGVYAIDETSTGFNGVVPRPIHRGQEIDPLKLSTGPRISVPNYHLIYSPGRHGTVAGNGTTDGKATPTSLSAPICNAGNLISRLASACLNKWGSNVPLSAYVANVQDDKRALRAASADFRNMRKYTYMPFDAHSPQHWTERGITSSDCRNPSDWHYLEDAIGIPPLCPRNSKIPNKLRKNRPAPGLVRWEALDQLANRAFDEGL